MSVDSPQNIADETILATFRKGDRIAIHHLYQKYLHVIYGVCLKYLQNREDAQDATSTLFEKFHTLKIPEDINNLKTWLYVVTKNHCLMQLRKTKREFSQAIPEDVMESDYELHPIDRAMQKERELAILMNCIDALKDEQKACIDLFYLKKHCYQEVAEQTGFEIKKVKSYIQNGKRNLKICIEGQHDE